MKRLIQLIAFSIITSFNLYCQDNNDVGVLSNNKIKDYRDVFLGNFDVIVYYHSEDYYSGTVIYDTLNTTAIVDKFLGYTAGNDSNYIDIEHKVGITYDYIDTTHDDSWCGWVNYYTEGFLHPTIENNGLLTYPELEACQAGFLNGFINNDTDSIHIYYGNSNLWGHFNRIIVGKRINTNINDLKDSKKIIKIFPNPVIDYFFVKGAGFDNNFIIVDLFGKMIFSGSINEKKIDVSFSRSWDLFSSIFI